MSAYCKVLVGYFSESKIIKNDWCVPMQLGASSQKDIPSLKFKDNVGDNISNLNKYFCELTATYWAWKNQDKLGNPEYVGLMHYRRLFDVQKGIKDFIDNHDIVTPYYDCNDTLMNQFDSAHHTDDLKMAVYIMKSLYPDYCIDADEYLSSKSGFFFNMFIMKRDIFNEYCAFLFPILFKLHDLINYENYSVYNIRMIGFVAERLTGIFIYHKQKKGLKIKKVQVNFLEHCSVKQELVPTKKSNKKTVNIASCCDDNYAPHLCVTIISAMKNSKNNNLYNFYIITHALSKDIEKSILSIELMFDNCKINLIDADTYISEFGIDKIKQQQSAHVTVETYYKLYIPVLFNKFEKILWIDSDTVVLRDLADLYDEQIDDVYFAAANDIEMQRLISTGDWYSYIHNYLGVKEGFIYKQAGVVLYNLVFCRKNCFSEKVNKFLEEHEELRMMDQDVLNAVCYKHIKKLNLSWNFDWHVEFQTSDIRHELKEDTYYEFLNGKKSPYIIHYASAFKPWNEIKRPLAWYYWEYAKFSPLFHKEIQSLFLGMEKNNKDIITKMQNEISHLSSTINYLYSVNVQLSKPKIIECLNALSTSVGELTKKCSIDDVILLNSKKKIMCQKICYWFLHKFIFILGKYHIKYRDKYLSKNNDLQKIKYLVGQSKYE